MAGMFELFIDAESAFRFRLTAPDGTVMAVSKPFATKTDAVAGIAAVREYAGMGLIADQCTTAANAAPPATLIDPGSRTDDYPRMPKIDFHARARAVRRAVSGPRWAGAVHSLS
ncbi:YegP family protein [Pseudarthrobacter sp. NPDC058196]|uniref:YegP family protein n=1 Tax=Pseudarthrobacter sp. NPDC058196 TaxID=3346376 RepID=UPI0036DC4CB8